MDNASKALIMAGAILISIAIVGVGVYIFSAVNGVQKGGIDQLDATEAQMTNSTLRQYEGTRIKGSQVIELIEYIAVLTANQTLPVAISYTGAVDSTDDVTATQFYSVDFTDADNDSYYDSVAIN